MDGFRHYFPEVPPRVEYELSIIGKSTLPVPEGFTDWIGSNWPAIVRGSGGLQFRQAKSPARHAEQGDDQWNGVQAG